MSGNCLLHIGWSLVDIPGSGWLPVTRSQLTCDMYLVRMILRHLPLDVFNQTTNLVWLGNISELESVAREKDVWNTGILAVMSGLR